jgi:hypothetical protein
MIAGGVFLKKAGVEAKEPHFMTAGFRDVDARKDACAGSFDFGLREMPLSREADGCFSSWKIGSGSDLPSCERHSGRGFLRFVEVPSAISPSGVND